MEEEHVQRPCDRREHGTEEELKESSEARAEIWKWEKERMV